MKTLTSIFVLISVFHLACSELFAQANHKDSYFTDINITCTFENTPQINAANVAGLPVPKLDWWLQISVGYKTVEKSEGKGSNKRYAWLDDVTLQYEIILPSNDKKMVCLTGKITYWSIPMDGKQHHAVAFVHPRFLQRYSPEIKTTNTFAKEIPIKLSFVLNEATLTGAFHPSKKSDQIARLFQNVARDPNITRVNDSIFGRDKTPWRDLNYDYYELIKQDGRK